MNYFKVIKYLRKKRWRNFKFINQAPKIARIINCEIANVRIFIGNAGFMNKN